MFLTAMTCNGEAQGSGRGNEAGTIQDGLAGSCRFGNRDGDACSQSGASEQLSTRRSRNIPPRRLRHSVNKHPGRPNRRGIRNRPAMRETGFGAIRICLRRNRSENCRTIPRFAVCLQKDSSSFDNDWSIFRICRRNSSCAC